MMRVAAVALVSILAAVPLTVLAGPPVTWLAVLVLVVGGAGVAVLSVSVATAGATLALIAYALALVIAQPPSDPVVAIAFGATLVVFLALVHLGGRVQGAFVGLRVVVSEVRQWLVVVASGVLAAAVLTAGGTALGSTLRGTTLPVVVVVSVVGALLVVGGAIALVMPREEPSAPAVARERGQRRT